MKIVLWQTGLLLFCLTGCGKSNSVSAEKVAPARLVTLVPIEARSLERTITVTGTLAAREHSTLSTKVSGRLQELAVDIGSPVKQGQVLARVEPKDYELGLKQAMAALAQARALIGLEPDGQEEEVEWAEVSTVKQAKAVLEEAAKNRDRIRELFGSRIASQSELDAGEAAYKVAATRFDSALEEARTRMATVAQRRAEVELAQKLLEDATLTAPFDGVVQSRRAGFGEYVSVGSPIITFVKTDPLRLQLQVPERQAPLVRTGQTVRVNVEGDSESYPGVVARLSPALDDLTRMLFLEADVPVQGPLRPGMFARAQIVIQQDEPALTVPPQAIITFAGIEKVVLMREGKAFEKVVRTGRQGDGWVEVMSELKAGERVVLNPGGLRTGQPLVEENEGRADVRDRAEEPAS